MRQRLRITAWWLALITVALITILAQIDRHARYAPRYSPLVPDSFASFAQTQIAVAAVGSGTQEQALTETKALISKRPIPAENLGLLSGAHARNGDTDRAVLALQLSASRGWRDRGSQIALLELAIEADNGVEAARRFAALLAVDGNQQLVSRFAPQVLRVAGAQAELDRLMQNGPRWEDRLVRATANIEDTPLAGPE